MFVDVGAHPDQLIARAGHRACRFGHRQRWLGSPTFGAPHRAGFRLRRRELSAEGSPIEPSEPPPDERAEAYHA